MRFALLGTRGIPANYGGFETFAEELAPRLAARGHKVTVYGRSRYITIPERTYKGCSLVVLPSVNHKYFDTVVNTFLAAVHVSFSDAEVVYICNSANALVSIIPRLFGKRVVLNVDGLEWKRAKWNALGRLWYKLGERLACYFPHEVITDSQHIERYYRERYGKRSTFIPYGAPTERVETTEALERFGVEPRKYILYVSRLEPENNAHLVIEAFAGVKTDMKLVIVGDAPYSQEYIAKLRATTDPRVVFTGYVFGKGYHEFQSHAYCYVQATEVGGTHPALLEAMGFGNCVLVYAVAENLETMGDAGIAFDSVESLRAQLQALIDEPDRLAEYQRRAVARIRAMYTWERVTDATEALCFKLLGAEPSVQAQPSARS